MTGEISLRGRVMRVGGIKEKVLAASRFGMKHIILPEQNKTDWEEVPAEVRKKTDGAFCEPHFRTDAAGIAFQMIQRRQILSGLFLLGAALAIAAKDTPTQPIVLSPEQAVKEGRALVDEMLSQKPAENTRTTGVMSIRANKSFKQIPIEFSVQMTATNWMSVYKAAIANEVEQFAVLHTANHPNLYFQKSYTAGSNGVPISSPKTTSVKADHILDPFAGSDFSIADLGLEFLHWPDQRLTKKEMKRSRSCRVLESINPHPAKGGYSKVNSWIDAESDGIVYAEAFDSNGKELKEFFPKDFSKVNGQWQLEEMQISNVQTDSSTTVKFHLEH